MELPEYLYGARKENGPTPQLAKDFVLGFGLLFTALCQAREVTSDSQIYWVRHVLKAVGVGDITAMADTFRRFEARPSFMVDHPAFDFFWAFLLPGGTSLVPEARNAIRAIASRLAVYAYIDERQAEEIVARALGAPSFEALMQGDSMPVDPLVDLHGSARRTWCVFTMHPEAEDLRRLHRASQEGEIRAEVEDLVRRFCRIFANASAGRENCHVDKFHDIYDGDALVGRQDAQTPEQHAVTWRLGGANGHLDALLLGREGEGDFVRWLTQGIEAVNENGVPLPVTVTVASSRKKDEPLAACVPAAADLSQYEV